MDHLTQIMSAPGIIKKTNLNLLNQDGMINGGIMAIKKQGQGELNRLIMMQACRDLELIGLTTGR